LPDKSSAWDLTLLAKFRKLLKSVCDIADGADQLMDQMGQLDPHRHVEQPRLSPGNCYSLTRDIDDSEPLKTGDTTRFTWASSVYASIGVIWGGGSGLICKPKSNRLSAFQQPKSSGKS